MLAFWPLLLTDDHLFVKIQPTRIPIKVDVPKTDETFEMTVKGRKINLPVIFRKYHIIIASKILEVLLVNDKTYRKYLKKLNIAAGDSPQGDPLQWDSLPVERNNELLSLNHIEKAYGIWEYLAEYNEITKRPDILGSLIRLSIPIEYSGKNFVKTYEQQKEMQVMVRIIHSESPFA